MKIKSRAPIGYVREANRVKNNSLDRLRALVIEANALIEDMERNRATIEAYRAESSK